MPVGEEAAMKTEEPEIIINGDTLTNGEAMTIRVALESFAADLHRDGLGDDAHGKRMTEGYLRAIENIRRSMFGVKGSKP
jgi:hypothetical protein